MRIEWKTDCEIEIVDSFDEKQDEVNDTHLEVICKGEIDDVDITEERDTTVDIQFGDGSMGYSIPKKWFKILGD